MNEQSRCPERFNAALKSCSTLVIFFKPKLTAQRLKPVIWCSVRHG